MAHACPIPRLVSLSILSRILVTVPIAAVRWTFMADVSLHLSLHSLYPSPIATSLLLPFLSRYLFLFLPFL